MILVLASREALDVMRTWPPERRRALRVKVHPDGGLWVAARSSRGQEDLSTLAERFGTRLFRTGGWRVLKPQLRLPGLVVGNRPVASERTARLAPVAVLPKPSSRGPCGPLQPDLPGLASVERGL
jgi:hypothetical protein